jgi:hypothetical protein
VSSARRALEDLLLAVEVTTVRSQLDRLRAAIQQLQTGTTLAEALQEGSPAFAAVTSTSVTDASTGEAKSSDKTSNTGLIIGVVVAAVVVLGVLVLVLMTRAANKTTRGIDEGNTEEHFANPLATTDVDHQGDGSYMHNSNDVYQAEDPRHAVVNDTYDTGRQAMDTDPYAVSTTAWEDSSA